MYKPGNVSRLPPVVVPHQPRLDWQMWFAALGPHTHSPWFTSLVLCLLQGKEPGEARGRGVGRSLPEGRGLWAGLKALPEELSLPSPTVIRLIQNDVARYPFHKQPPTFVRAQRYKYWFSQPGEQG